MQKLFYKKLNSTKLKKTPGWIGLIEEAKLSGYSGPFSWCEPEYVHLWIATQATKGSEELQVKIASSAAICHMGSVLMD